MCGAVILDWFEHPLARAAVLFALILLLTAGAIQVARRFRGRVNDTSVGTGEMLTKFRELHDQGGLSEEEFQTIKTRLADQMQAELKDSDQTG